MYVTPEQPPVFLDIFNSPNFKLNKTYETKYITEKIKLLNSASKKNKVTSNRRSNQVSDENLIGTMFTGQIVTREFSANGCIPCSQSSSRIY